MIDELQPEIVLPPSVIHYPTVEDTRTLALLTQGRLPPGRDYGVIERRAKRLMYALGGRFKGIEGSQINTGDDSYYTETVSHEYGHALHYGLGQSKPLGIPLDCAIDAGARESNNCNEIDTSASTMLVLEYLGMPYAPYQVVWSTYRNLRGYPGPDVPTVYLEVMAARAEEKVKTVARRIACRILKIKYGEA